MIPGTLSLTPELLSDTVRAYAEWAAHSGLRRLVFVNGHFGNAAALGIATDHLRLERTDLRAGFFGWLDADGEIAAEVFADGNDVHANRAESSLMLFVRPELVHVDRLADADDPDRTAGLVFLYTACELSANGVTGTPSLSLSLALGQRLFAAVDVVTDRVIQGRSEALHPFDPTSSCGVGRERAVSLLRRRRTSGPVIGVTMGRQPIERYSLHARIRPRRERGPGAFPVIPSPIGPSTDVDRLLAQVLACDALLVSGGEDVDPELSKIRAPGRCGRSLPDPLTTSRSRRSTRRSTPVAECSASVGGAQVLAVAFGGTLVGDLANAGFANHDEVDRQYEPVHAIHDRARLDVASSVLGEITEVNSAAPPGGGEVLGPGSGRRHGPDGDTIEATEGPGALGIQWHPERLIASDSRHLAPVEWLLS